MADREGFNPCCFGLAVLARCNRAAVDPLRCFNPCCFGLAVLAKLEITGQTQESEFQSLLFWISRFGQWGSECGYVVPVFQSLLFWISRFGFFQVPQAIEAIYCFNPCCFGLAVLAKTQVW